MELLTRASKASGILLLAFTLVPYGHAAVAPVATGPVAPASMGVQKGDLGAKIGVIAAVSGKVELVSRGTEAGRVVGSGEAIYANDVIKTGPDASLQIMLKDQSVFTVGKNSSVRINEFNFDPMTGDGTIEAEVLDGVFKFVTGQIAKKKPENMNIKLPSGVMGVRGTIGLVQANGLAKSSTSVLLGPGKNTNTNARVGALVLSNNDAGGNTKSVRIDRPGFGSKMAPGVPPNVFKVPASELKVMTDAVAGPGDSGPEEGDDNAGPDGSPQGQGKQGGKPGESKNDNGPAANKPGGPAAGGPDDGNGKNPNGPGPNGPGGPGPNGPAGPGPMGPGGPGVGGPGPMGPGGGPGAGSGFGPGPTFGPGPNGPGAMGGNFFGPGPDDGGTFYGPEAGSDNFFGPEGTDDPFAPPPGGYDPYFEGNDTAGGCDGCDDYFDPDDIVGNTGEILDGLAKFEDLYTIPMGEFHFQGSGQLFIAGTTTVDGSYNIKYNIDFGSRTFGGGTSQLSGSASSIDSGDSFNFIIPERSFDGSVGPAFLDSFDVVDTAGSVMTAEADILVDILNVGGNAGAGAFHHFVIEDNGSDKVDGAGVASRQPGVAP